jgi:dTDP-4-amino-4,6-dideoxygalactose transaminase
MILTDNKDLAAICRALRMYGMKDGYYSEIEGYNSRLDEVQAAILNVKLKYLDQWNEQRRKIAGFYFRNIKNQKIILPRISKITVNSFHLFVVRINNRNFLERYLKASHIGYGIHYPRPIHLQKAYKFLGYKRGDFPLTEKFAEQILSLPIFPELTESELKYVVSRLNRWHN